MGWPKVIGEQGSSYLGVPLSTGGTYQSDRRSIWMVHQYAPMYYVLVLLVRLDVAQYILYCSWLIHRYGPIRRTMLGRVTIKISSCLISHSTLLRYPGLEMVQLFI